MSRLREAALRIVRKNILIFPLRPKTKEPYGDDKFYRIKGGYKCATRDVALTEFWWDRQPHANIGAPTGAINGFWVFDVDGDLGRETLATLEEQRGQLPKTVEVITPGKINRKTGEHTGRGLHQYYRWPLGRADIHNAQGRDDVPGLDWRGNGGYVVLPPSEHPDGGNYAWSVDSADTFADAPDWLIELVTSKPRGGTAGRAHTPEYWRSALDDHYSGSDRGRFIASYVGILIHYNVPLPIVLVAARDHNARHCDPPLSDSEVVGIVARIKRNEDEARAEREAQRYAEPAGPDWGSPP